MLKVSENDPNRVITSSVLGAGHRFLEHLAEKLPLDIFSVAKVRGENLTPGKICNRYFEEGEGE